MRELLRSPDLDLTPVAGRVGLSAVSAAAQIPRFDILRLLFEDARFDVNRPVTGGFREPLLLLAVKMKEGEAWQDELVRMVLERDGVDVNGRDYVGNTPLMMAIQSGRRRAVRWLLQRYVRVTRWA